MTEYDASPVLDGTTRRTVLRAGAGVAVVAWATPVVNVLAMSSAASAGSLPPGPNPPPPPGPNPPPPPGPNPPPPPGPNPPPVPHVPPPAPVVVPHVPRPAHGVVRHRTAPKPATYVARARTAPAAAGGALPFTGFDVLPAVVGGAAAVGLGAGLVIAARQSEASDS